MSTSVSYIFGVIILYRIAQQLRAQYKDVWSIIYLIQFPYILEFCFREECYVIYRLIEEFGAA